MFPDALLKTRMRLPSLLLFLVPPKDPTLDYCDQHTHLSVANKVLHQQVKKLLAERQLIWQKVHRLQMQRREEEHKARADSSAANMATASPTAGPNMPSLARADGGSVSGMSQLRQLVSSWG